jgi:two-component system OmpR family sensor kinase
MGSILILILIIASMFYKMEYKYEYDVVVTKMKMKANHLASEIIMNHMKGIKFDPKEYKGDSKCALELYNKNQEPILNNIKDKINFNKKVYIKDNMIYMVLNDTFGHQNVYTIVLKNHWFLDHNKLLEKTILIFTSIFIIMMIVGYLLGKLFLKPILIQREKLNNFIKDTTHELNTPITALLMSINKKDVTSKNNINRINLSAKRISEIYMDLTYLFLEKKENNEVKQIEVKNILIDNLHYFEELALKKHIDLNIDISSVKVNIDKESFTRLTNNLISNAIKYTNQNGKIHITLKNNMFIIKDSGIGISKDQQKDIFDRFYRATNTSGGFGIGLDIVSNICTRYNIKIKLDSKENEGSTFILNFKEGN